jgi:hypothetical protein
MKALADVAVEVRKSPSDTHFNNSPMSPYDDPTPATKGDLNRLRDELIEKMRDMQTEVIRAFQNWATPVSIQLRSIPQIEARLGLLEERVTAIEQGHGPSKSAN